MNTQDKEKILEKIRKEGRDEGLDYVQQRGLRSGFILFSILAIFFIAFNAYTGQRIYSLLSLLGGFVAADAYSKYRFSKSKAEFIRMIGALILCFGWLINHVADSLR
ncbi:MAG: DUF6442 family protein [Peptostreptococcaceae bacterium]|nr:DUF6442 family protein [Peptostreptococcaceae bacterium]